MQCLCEVHVRQPPGALWRAEVSFAVLCCLCGLLCIAACFALLGICRPREGGGGQNEQTPPPPSDVYRPPHPLPPWPPRIARIALGFERCAAKIAIRGSKSTPRSPQERPRAAKRHPRAAKSHPRAAKSGQEQPQEPRKVAKRWEKAASSHQKTMFANSYVFLWFLPHLRALNAKKSEPRAAKSGPRATKSGRERAKSAPRAAKSGSRARQERPRASQERPRAP